MNIFDPFTPDRVRAQWSSIRVNGLAALVNWSLAAWNHNWLSLLNLAAAVFSTVVAYRLWRRLPEIKRRQEQRILEILKGQR